MVRKLLDQEVFSFKGGKRDMEWEAHTYTSDGMKKLEQGWLREFLKKQTKGAKDDEEEEQAVNEREEEGVDHLESLWDI